MRASPLFVAAILGAAGLARGQEASYPLLGGTPFRNMTAPSAKGLPETWSIKKNARKNILWSAELGTTTYGAVVVSGGRIFIGTNNERPRDPAISGDKGALYCFSAMDGAFLWQALHDKLPEPDKNDWPKQGVASTPVIEGDRLWYVSNRAEVVCLDAAGTPGTTKAKEIWKLDMVKDLGVFPCYLAMCSPLVHGPHVFVVTGHGVDHESHKVPNPKAPSFVCLDKATGKVVWKDSSPGENIMEGQWSNPTLAKAGGIDQVVFPGGDGWLYSFEPATGKKLWKFDCNTKKSAFKPGGRGDKSYIMATPVFHNGKIYASVGNNPDDGPGPGHLWCVDPAKPGAMGADGFRDLSPVADNLDPAAPANKDSGLVWHLGGPVLPKPTGDGRDIHFGRTLSTVAVADGLIYAAEIDGYLHCLDASTGKKHWDHDLKDGTWCSPMVADGRVYIGTDSGDILVFPHGKAKKEPAKIEMDQAIKSPPTPIGGVLYLHNGTTLFAIGTK